MGHLDSFIQQDKYKVMCEKRLGKLKIILRKKNCSFNLNSAKLSKN